MKNMMLMLCKESQNLSIEIILRKDILAAAAAGAVGACLVTVLVMTYFRGKKEEPKTPAGIVSGAQRYTKEPEAPVMAGETSVLARDMEDMSFPEGMMRAPAATLIRRKTGERIRIYREVFSLGKDRHRVDYCISGNHAVSRLHVHIRCRGGTYYIADMNSTNFTFVNGRKIMPNHEIRLHSGDKIMLADEEFIFFETVSI